MLRSRLRCLSSAVAGIATLRLPQHVFAEERRPNRDPPNKSLSKLRTVDFPLEDQWYGKLRVRVLKVRKEESGAHTVSEYTVHTKLFGQFEQCYTQGDNTGIIATDTQKNNVYLVAKRTSAPSPEQFGVDISAHFLNEYPQIKAVEVEVHESAWQRADVEGLPHEHGFLRSAPMEASAVVTLHRSRRNQPEVTSRIRGLQVLKTTQAGWENFLQERFTTLADTDERCVCTDVSVDWTYVPKTEGDQHDYKAIRRKVLERLCFGFFGPARGGVYSPSVQSTVYDIGCMVLAAEPAVAKISIVAPNIHQIPQKDLLQKLGEEFENDVYMPTNEPSGIISVHVKR